MDKSLYIAMTGAKHNMEAQTLHANNLANANTNGFRRDLAQARSMQTFGEGYPTRVYALTERPATDFRVGPRMQTGYDLDIAIDGEGWIAVETGYGEEAYTRAGSMKISPDGQLQTGNGLPVLGNISPIVFPPIEKVVIGADGSVSIRELGQGPDIITVFDRLRLVNPDPSEFEKGVDGLFRLKSGLKAIPDGNVRVVSGFLESSNVNAVHALTEMISLTRQFELQIKLMKEAEKNSESSARLLQIS